jgi:hypothetical protein
MVEYKVDNEDIHHHKQELKEVREQLKNKSNNSPIRPFLETREITQAGELKEANRRKLLHASGAATGVMISVGSIVTAPIFL